MADPPPDPQPKLLFPEFWKGLLDRAKQTPGSHARFAPARKHWVDLPTSKRGIKFSYVIREHDAEVVLVIEGSPGQRAFEALLNHRGEVDAAFGAPLDWPTHSGNVRRRIGHVMRHGGYRDRERWPAIQEEMVRRMEALSEAFGPHIRRLHFVPDAQ